MRSGSERSIASIIRRAIRRAVAKIAGVQVKRPATPLPGRGDHPAPVAGKGTHRRAHRRRLHQRHHATGKQRHFQGGRGVIAGGSVAKCHGVGLVDPPRWG